MVEPLVNTLNAQRAVVAGHIDNVYMSALPPAQDYVLDFSGLIASATAGFVGRTSVFAAIDAFGAQHNRGYFEIVADAGLGKTALAAEVARRRDAIAFFASASRGRRLPQQFLTHVCGELITRHGLGYDHLPAQAGEGSSFLERLLGEAVAAQHGRPVWIVVDALDEADEPAPDANPLLLPPELPVSVFVLVTRRAGRDLITVPGTPIGRHVIRRDDAEQEADIAAWLRAQATTTARLSDALAQSKPAVPIERFVARLKEASDGNFMYVSYVLADIADRQPGADPLDLDDLPKGLPGYYEQFWSRMQAPRESSWADWDGLYRPTIEALGVAAEAVTVEWLATCVGRPASEIRERALQRWERLLSREQRSGRETWRLVHRSFADFLAGKVDLRAAHASVGRRYVEGLHGDWTAWDDYGLRNAATHLVEAARLGSQPDRHVLIDSLAALVTAPGYQDAKLSRLPDPTLLERDLVAALRAAATDEDERASLLAIEVALALTDFRREQRRPGPVFDLARRGQVEAAARRLDLFSLEVDRDWYNALLLTIAWLAPAGESGAARMLRDQVRAEGPGSPTLALLLQLVDAALGDAPMPDVEHPDSAPSPMVVIARVERLGGAQGASFLRAEFGPQLRPDRGDHEFVDSRGYLAEDDGPLLVAAAAYNPAFAEPLLRQYVAIHAAYGYRQYRQGSLWALLGAVLHHPVQEWVQTWAAALGEAALAPNRGEFAESLGLAVLFVRARAGDAAALADIERRQSEALAHVATMQDARSERGAGDTWAVHKRRLAALAEVCSGLPNGSVDANRLLTAALGLSYGFAGFHAPACLTLAEAIEIAAPGSGRNDDSRRIDDALSAALTSAHNIQDATFCARTTARVNAFRERWWGEPGAGTAIDVSSTAQRLLEEPSSPAFTALHKVGEAYLRRHRTLATRLPPRVLEARSLEALADAYQRPLVDFLRANAEHGWEPQQKLADGVLVNVPDPGLPPLIAARLAARALADSGMSDAERSAAIRCVVPVAALEPTALNTVLARLLEAWKPSDAGTLDRLSNLAAAMADQQQPDAELAGRLTAFMP